MRAPAIRLLLHIFIRQHAFKRPAMQIHVQHILGGKSGSGQPGDKQFVDEAITLLPDLVGRGCAGMTGHNQSHARSSRREGDVRAIVEGTGGATFRMGTDHSGRARQHGLNFCQIQQRIIAAPCNEAQTRVQDIHQHSSVAIQAVQTHQHLGGEKCVRRRILSDHLQSALQFCAVVAIARSPKGAQELMGMRLQQRGAGAHHFPSLAPLVLKAAATRSKRR